MKKLLKIIITFIYSIINWFKDLFKKDNKVINNKQSKIEDVINIPIQAIKGTINTCSSILGGHKLPKQNLTIEEVEEEIKDLIEKKKDLSLKEQKKAINKINNKLIILKEVEDKRKISNPKDKVEHKDNIKRIDKQIEVIEQLKENNEVEIKNIQDQENIKNDQELTKYKTYVEDANKVLKDGKKLIKEIEEELTKHNDSLDNCKYKIEELKGKISSIRKQYYEFKHSDYIFIIEEDFFLNQLDEYNIIKNSKQIDNYLLKCNKILESIEVQRYKRLHEKEQIKEKKEEKKVKKPILEEQPKTEIPKIIVEIEQASNVIKKDIKEQNKEVKKINEKLDIIPIHERKKKKLGFFDNFLTNTFKLGLSLLPLKMFKNKALGMLVSGTILNNRIRSMRKILNKDVECEYVQLNRRIKNQIDIINGYDTICNDSLYQISALKDEFIRTYGYDIENEEVKKSFTKLVDLEERVINQQKNLQNTRIKLNKKVKVKRIERT